MTCARDLALKGYQVTVFEKLPVAGGMLRVSIPAYRLPKDVVQKEVDQIASLGVEVKVNQALGKDFTIDSPTAGFKAIFIAPGRTRPAADPGEKDFRRCSTAPFLRDVNLDNKPTTPQEGRRVGGGNAAIDSARTSLRLGADVVIAYRRPSRRCPPTREMGARRASRSRPRGPGPGARRQWRVTGLEVQKMQLGEPGWRPPPPGADRGFNYVLLRRADRRDQPGAGSRRTRGRKPQDHQAAALRTTATLATSRPGVFAGGDGHGPSTVVQAIGMGETARNRSTVTCAGSTCTRPSEARARPRNRGCRGVVTSPKADAGSLAERRAT
jgi:NADPH-dependent glutamate synthase beta subunit-like oxidoreductase